MKQIILNDLKRLAKTEAGTCVSAYMPTVKSGSETEQNKIRYKNLLRKVGSGLMEAGFSMAEKKNMIEKAWELHSNNWFWEHQEEGIVLFITPDSFEYFSTPFSIEEEVVINNRFYLRPLFVLNQLQGDFFVLALSMDEAVLYKGDSQGLVKHEVKNAPSGIQDIVQYDQADRQLQHHGSDGNGRPMFHGQEADDTFQHKQLIEYVRQLANAFDPEMKKMDYPLVLCGLEEIIALYRKESGYAHITRDEIRKHPRNVGKDELFMLAREILAEEFSIPVKNALHRFKAQARSGAAADILAEIIPASLDHRVETLIIPREKKLWGRYDHRTQVLDPHQTQKPGDCDLYDMAARHTLLNGGNVYVLPENEIPSTNSALALLRY